ncbi:hypothetical protein [Fuerstiella marisgermanici]|uniref:Uncharacterized protein n=1 Tax=Fuerstiella marisgermanici TaxID=1891926 RepID=A0A1P8WDJ7_9PLAN|nr:hypothetical protein [Fuerstiella marisgermanici]APZ92133.1 hypothetical protein Fuma_01738 [Fuerstiella marisgermanici]
MTTETKSPTEQLRLLKNEAVGLDHSIESNQLRADDRDDEFLNLNDPLGQIQDAINRVGELGLSPDVESVLMRSLVNQHGRVAIAIRRRELLELHRQIHSLKAVVDDGAE